MVTQSEIAPLGWRGPTELAVRPLRAHMLARKHPGSAEHGQYAEGTERGEASTRCGRGGGQGSSDTLPSDRRRHRPEKGSGGGTCQPWREGSERGAKPGARKEIARKAAMTRYGRNVETKRPDPNAVMTEKERLDLTARLAAYEMLLAELLIVLYAQKGFGNRLLNFRKRMEEQFSDVIQDDEDHPVEIDPRRKALYEHVMGVIDTAVRRLVEQKQAHERSDSSR